jgi:hypothetical protein
MATSSSSKSNCVSGTDFNSMDIQSVPETLVDLNHLTWLSMCEDFTEFCGSDSFKIYTTEYSCSGLVNRFLHTSLLNSVAVPASRYTLLNIHIPVWSTDYLKLFFHIVPNHFHMFAVS